MLMNRKIIVIQKCRCTKNDREKKSKKEIKKRKNGSEKETTKHRKNGKKKKKTGDEPHGDGVPIKTRKETRTEQSC